MAQPSGSDARTGTITGRGWVLATDGSRALHPIFARYLTRCHEGYLALRPRLAPTAARIHERTSAALRSALVENRRAALACFASPTLGTAIQCAPLRDELAEFAPRIDAALEAVSPHLFFELGLRGLVPGGLTLDVPGTPRLASHSLGVAIEPPAGTTALRFEPRALVAIAGSRACGTLRFDDPAGADGFVVQTPFRRVGNVTRFATIDHNPIAAFEAHPDKAGNHVDLGGHAEDEWASMLDEAFALIAAHLPETFAEMGFLLREVIPVGFDAERHLSASYREAIGTVYLTLHPNVMTMAEALIHEFQHNKLNLASYSTELLENAFHPRYPSPVRPDPRPLWGILLAVHAFVPVAVLYRRMREAGHPRAAMPDFARRLSEIDLKNHEGVAMLRAHAQWTPVGRAVMDDLEALDARHMAERAAGGLAMEPTDVHPS